jgi:nicotinamidase-related amidase
MQALEARSTAVVLIDLQQGILPFAQAPHDAAAIVRQAAQLCAAAREAGALVVRVRVGWAPDQADRPNQPTDQPAPAPQLPPHWWDDPEGLPAAEADLAIVKRHWNAFHATELDLQLRRRRIRTVVLGGIATPFGVESTARTGWELGYELLFPEDLSGAPDEALHRHSMQRVLPRLGRVVTVAQVVDALREGAASKPR